MDASVLLSLRPPSRPSGRSRDSEQGQYHNRPCRSFRIGLGRLAGCAVLLFVGYHARGLFATSLLYREGGCFRLPSRGADVRYVVVSPPTARMRPVQARFVRSTTRDQSCQFTGPSLAARQDPNGRDKTRIPKRRTRLTARDRWRRPIKERDTRAGGRGFRLPAARGGD